MAEGLAPGPRQQDTASPLRGGKVQRYAAPSVAGPRRELPPLAPIETLFGGGGAAAGALDAATGSPGQPVAAPIRKRVEAASGADLSGVRVHDDPASARAAAAISAHAYADGQHVHFADGQHRPGTAEGDRLLAHELAHTIQARSHGDRGELHGKLEVSQPGDAQETEADAFADAVMSGAPAPTLGAGGTARAARTIHRDAAPAPQLTLMARVPPGVLLTDGVRDPVTDALAREIWVTAGTGGYEQFYVNCPADGTPHFLDDRGAPLITARSFGRAQYDTLIQIPQVQQIAGTGATEQAAACATAIRAAFDEGDGQEILRQLNLGPETVRAAVEYYDARLNDLGGQGLVADIEEHFPGLYDQAVVELRTAGVTVNVDTGVDLASDPTGASAEQNARRVLAMGRIVASPAGALATPGTSITYAVDLPDMLTRQGYTVHGAWSSLHDSSNHPENAWDGLSGPVDSLSWQVTWTEPGVQRVQVGIFGSWPEAPQNIWPFQNWQNDPRVVLLQHTQVVLPQQVAVDAAFATSSLADPQQTKAQLQQYLDAYRAAAEQSGSAIDPSVVAAIEAQIAAIDDVLAPTAEQQRTAIHAVHVATETGQVTPLQVLVAAPDSTTPATAAPTGSGASGSPRTWSIIDATNPNDPRLNGTHIGTGADDAAAIRAAIAEWERLQQYPYGVIRLEIPASVAQEAINYQFATTNERWVDLAEFLQAVGAAVSIAGTFGALICPPLGVLAFAGAALSTAGAVVNMAQGHYFGTATAGSDAMDLLTIATSFFSFGKAIGQGARIMSNGVLRGFVVGELVTNSAQLLVMDAGAITQALQAMQLEDPQQRLDALLNILGNALLNNTLTLISIRSSAVEYGTLGRPLEPQVAAADFLDPTRQIEIGPNIDATADATADAMTGETAADSTPAVLTGEAAADGTAADPTVTADADQAELTTATDSTAPASELVDVNGRPTLAAVQDPMGHPEWPRFRDVMARYGIDEAVASAQWEKVCRGLELQATGGNGEALFQEVADWMVATSGIDQFQKPALWAGWPSGALAQECGFNALGDTSLGDALAPLQLFNGNFPTEIRPLWAAISRAFANQLQGDVHIFMARFSADSIVLTEELPIIRQRQLDGFVGEIIFHAIDPASMPNGDTSNAIFLDASGQPADFMYALGSELDVQAALTARATATSGGGN